MAGAAFAGVVMSVTGVVAVGVVAAGVAVAGAGFAGAGVIEAGAVVAGAGCLVSEFRTLSDLPAFLMDLKPRKSPSERTRNRMMSTEVVFVSTLPASPPNADSAAPPPSAAPMPAFALGRCMRITSTVSRATKARMSTPV